MLQAPAGIQWQMAIFPMLISDLMLPNRPLAFDANFAREYSHSRTICGKGADLPIDHHSQICPTCSQRLTGHRCKLVCTHCGYYLSCADYC
jgi:hypothetical protein